MLIEVVGFKGVVGNATLRWLRAMRPATVGVVGRDKGDTVPGVRPNTDMVISILCVPETVIHEAAAEAARYADLLVVRSTVVPGTCAQLQKETGKHVCHNPEFLREATSVMDTFNPEFVLLGCCCHKHQVLLEEMYEASSARVVSTSRETSELTKLSINCYLSTLISYWNEIEAIALSCGTTGHRVGAIASLDPRVSAYGAKFHQKFDGRCLPKDLKQLTGFAKGAGIVPHLLQAVREVNDCQT